MTYEYKSKPYEHQHRIFEETRDLEAYGLFWEQGVGKSKPTIDTASYLFECGVIDALVVVAPSGVERNWITDELPVHMPDRVRKRTYAFFYETKKAKRASYKSVLDTGLRWGGMVVLAMSYDAFITEKGKAYAGQFMRKRKCLLVVDESQGIKTPDAIRTKTLMAARKFSQSRRILSGTPVTQGPFDVYSQMKFLDDDFWKKKGIASWSAYKAHFGKFEQKPFGPGGRMIDICVGYRNIDDLTQWLPEITHRLTKDDALDLPDKIYQKRYVELTEEQWKHYENLKVDMMTVVGNDPGNIVEAPLAITQAIRFQQIISGYVTDIDGNVISVTERNPRLNAFQQIAEEQTRPGLVWARFTKDIDLIMEMLAKIGKRAARYDGSTSDDERAQAKKDFQDGKLDWMVLNQAAGATGLTLTRAKVVVYYSNSFRLVDRLQSEDRAHRIGQTDHVTYIDLVAPDTIDEKIVTALREKKDIAGQITGDSLKEWI